MNIFVGTVSNWITLGIMVINQFSHIMAFFLNETGHKCNIYLLLNLGRLVGLMAPSETLIGNSGTGPEIVVTKTRKLTLTGKR
jgi:hypothetical protein